MELLNHKILGEGQPLIILHGFFGSLDNWLTLGKRFSENYKVVLVDQRNHGKSFHSEEFGYEEMVEDLDKLIRDLSLDKPILLGHSMGGKSVMQYVAYFPDAVDKLIVADIGPKQYPVHHELILQGLAAIATNALKSRNQADEILTEYVPEAGIRTFLLKNLKRTSVGFEWKMNLPILTKEVEMIGEGLNYRLPVEVETLFIRGGNSGYVKDEDFEDIRGIFPEATFETIVGAGHWLHAEKPKEFYQRVINFLTK